LARVALKLGILESTDPSSRNYVRACEELGQPHAVIPFMAPDWLERLQESDCDGFLARPPCDYPERKAVYDERLYVVAEILRKPVYPALHEMLFYENKRLQTHVKELFGIPSPATWVFTDKREAAEFLRTAPYPLVSKNNIGSAGSGITILKTPGQARRHLHAVFGLGLENLSFGKVYAKAYMGIPVPLLGSVQRNYVTLQQWHDIKWEWRLIRIGNSYFGRQKLKGDNGLASGSKIEGWAAPPRHLLDLLRDTCDRLKFHSMALDVFETVDDRFLVNEMQAVFGCRHPAQLYVDGKPGRYVWRDGDFVFEEGFFNRLASYPLRVEHFVELLASGRYDFDPPRRPASSRDSSAA
jgi:hypothetical protein